MEPGTGGSSGSIYKKLSSSFLNLDTEQPVVSLTYLGRILKGLRTVCERLEERKVLTLPQIVEGRPRLSFEQVEHLLLDFISMKWGQVLAPPKPSTHIWPCIYLFSVKNTAPTFIASANN